ncbi:hypothetical protein F0562_001716 [Nyssa sinensis]|uniref:Uncharacterized protein n=1 Tax=Nyssa sinensis TaxID=561372 RepID=A0A5J5C7V2_9ASTE|nr:hypothetical protein F0562_001716 [Nyssa sinensis]
MAIKQPLSAVFIDLHDATDVPPSTNDSDPASRSPHQNLITSTDHGANVSPNSQVTKSFALHATDDPSDFIMARMPSASHEDSGEYIPKEALELEKDYGGFTLNSDFLIN